MADLTGSEAPPKGKELKIIRAAIAERYNRQQPQIGPGIQRWMQEIADEFGVEYRIVQYVVANEKEMAAMTMRGIVSTRAEEMAAITGANVARAFQVFAEGMEATSERVVKDSHGNVQLGADGKPIVHISPDYGERRKNAVEVIKATIGFAPVKHEIESHSVVEHLGDAELMKQLADTAARVTQYISGNASGTRATEGARAGAQGKAGPVRPLVLVDGVYEDQGRAGSSEPVQAVPAEGIPPADA